MAVLRRRTLVLGAAATLAALRPGRARATAARTGAGQRLALLNTHTGEGLDVIVHDAGATLPDAQSRIDHLLRDHRNDQVHPIDARLIDQLLALRGALELTLPFHVISGYRSPATNARLAAAGHGVARHSLHQSGRAIDIRAPGVDLPRLRAAALALRAGGVGYYPRSDFVHLDTGGVRTW
jgi:uncharacterized protein YcbK (DUF882 family)